MHGGRWKRVMARFDTLFQKAGRGFLSTEAWRFVGHKYLLWMLITSPLFVMWMYGSINESTHLPKFLADFFASLFNIGWVLVVPIVSTILIAGLFCLLGANKWQKVALDDARRTPGTVSAIWFWTGMFFTALGPQSKLAGFDLIVLSIFSLAIHFFFWAITENDREKQQHQVDQHHP